ncbi:MAG: aminotransferase class IV [Deltaproteobacteria bacterium]|nr:aminotransferase class IV [Deltaproteobacteria bacterium]
MLNERWIFSDDKFIVWEAATVHVASHSFARGSAIFEVLSLHETATGPVIFRLDEHVRRFFRSAHLLGMELGITPDALMEQIKETVRKNKIQKGVIKVVGYHPEIALDILPPARPLSLVIFAVDPEKDLPHFSGDPSREAAACIPAWRKLDPRTVPVEAKASANYLNGMVARLEARKKGFDYAIMLDTQGFVAEGGTESIFIVKDGILMTPVAGTVLQSITRKSLLELAMKKGIASKELRIPPEQLLGADEAFLSCTPFKVLPLVRIEDRSLPGASGPVTQRLAGLMEDAIDGKETAFSEWRFPVD